MFSIVRYGLLAALAAALLTFSSPASKAQEGVNAPELESVSVIIGLKPGPVLPEVAQARVDQQVQGLGGKVKHRYSIIPAVSANLPPAAVANLLDNPAISFVELDGEFQAIAETTPWGIDKIRALQNPNNGGATEYNGGTGVVVAVLDTGVDLDHPDLAANIYVNPGEILDGVDNDNNGFIDDISGWNFNGGNNNADDDNGHGTHCAGSVAAVGNNGIGVVGVAPQASIMPIKVLSGSGGGSFSAIIAGIDYVYMMKQRGVNVVVTSNSYGAGGNPGSAVQAAFDQAYQAGIIHLAAAGNSGSSSGTGENVGWPANYASVIAVASTTSSDARSSFSSTGANVEIAAPGSSILSTYPGGSYATLSGTSMACPHAAGAAAVLISEAGLLNISDGNNANGIADEVRSLLAATSVDLGAAGKDTQYGYGRIDLFAARSGSGGDGGGGDGGGGDGGGGDGGGGGDPATEIIKVQRIEYRSLRRGRDLQIRVYVVDGDGQRLSGANVTINLYGPYGDYGNATGTTNSKGIVKYRLRYADRGTYLTSVLNMALEGYEWDPDDPNNYYIGDF